MHRHSRLHRPAITLAAAGALGLIASGIAQAGPATGSGVPIDTVQPSLGVTYLVRTQDPTNFADVGQVEAFAGSVVPGGFSVANGQLVSIATNPARRAFTSRTPWSRPQCHRRCRRPTLGRPETRLPRTRAGRSRTRPHAPMRW